MTLRSDKRYTVLGLATSIVSLAVQLAISFFLSAFLVSAVGVVATGFNQLANNFIAFGSLLTLAFNSMGSRFISRSFHKGEVQQMRSYYSTLVVCNIGLSLLFLLASIAIVFNLNQLVSIGDADYADVQLLFLFAFVNYIVTLYSSLFSVALFVTNKLYISNVITAVRSVANALALLFVYNFLIPKVQYVSLVSLVLTLFIVPVLFLAKKRLVSDLFFEKKLFSRASLCELVTSGLWNTLNQGGHILSTGLDLLLANWLVSPFMMGMLSVAKTVPNAIISLASTLNANLEPSLVIENAKGGISSLFGELIFGVKLSNMLVAVPIGVFAALSVEFYALWMPELDSSMLAALSFLTIMAFVPWAGLQNLYNVFTVTNRLKVNSLAFFCGSVLNCVVVVALLVLTDLGVFAIAGVSSVISILRNVVVTAPYTALLLGKKWYAFYKYALSSICCCGLSALVAVCLKLVFSASSWLALCCVGIGSCLISFFLVFVATFNREERTKILALAKRRKNASVG